jgi:hypothetical protein
MSLTRRWFGGLLLLLLSTLLMLAAGEGLLRLVDDRLLPAWGWRWAESPYRAEQFPVAGEVNQLGLRGQRIEYGDRDFVVVIAGDSYTEAGHQPIQDMPERILQALLREQPGLASARVFSVASAGWGQDQQLLALREYFAAGHRADLVIAWLTPVNDFWENAYVERSVTDRPGRLKPTFRLADDGRLQGPRDRHSDWRLVDLLVRALAADPAGREMQVWNAGLPAARSLLPSPAATDCPAREVSQDDMVAEARAGAQALTVTSTEAVADARSHFAPFGLPRSPREGYQLALTRELLRQMASTSREQGAAFAAFYPRGTDIDRALSRVHCVRAAGRLHAVDLSDPLGPLSLPDPGFPVIAPVMDTPEPTTVSSRDWHLNRRGNEIALAGLVGELTRLGLLSSRR